MQDILKAVTGLIGLVLVGYGVMAVTQASGNSEPLTPNMRLWGVAILSMGLAFLPKSLGHPLLRPLLGLARGGTAANRGGGAVLLAGARRNAVRATRNLYGQMHVALPVNRDKVPTGWLGGCPALPPSRTWPQIAGAPARFLAQIDCAQLPEGTWTGKAPLTGQLAFFCGMDDPAQVRVLHVTGPLDDRFPPDDALPAGSPDALAQRQAKLLGRSPDHTRWPLAFGPGKDSDVVTPSDCPPFDWNSLFLTVSLASATLCARIRALTPTDGGPAENPALVHDLIRRQTQLTALETELRRAGKLAAFSDDMASLTRTALDRLDTPPDGLEGSHLLLDPDTTAAIRAAQEMHARVLSLVAPDHLPDGVARTHAPLWSHYAARYPLRLDGPVDAARFADQPRPVRLLCIPSGGLTGWAFGPTGQSTLHIHANVDDIAIGDFAQAWGEVLD